MSRSSLPASLSRPPAAAGGLRVNTFSERVSNSTPPNFSSRNLTYLASFMLASRFLLRQHVADGGLDLGVGRRDLGMALAVLQLRGKRVRGTFVALVLRGDVLERGAHLLRVHRVAVEAALGLDDVGARLRERCTRGDGDDPRKPRHLHAALSFGANSGGANRFGANSLGCATGIYSNTRRR